MPTSPDRRSGDQKISQWIESAFRDADKMRAEVMRDQRKRVEELYQQLSREKNPAKINYELLLIKKIHPWSPQTRWNGRAGEQRYNSLGQPVFTHPVELDEASTFTYNGIDPKKVVFCEDIELETADFQLYVLTDQAESEEKTVPAAEPFLGDIIIRVVDGVPGSSDIPIITSVVIRHNFSDETVQTNLDYLKREINRYINLPK
jgi:hypothetical protein